MYAIKLKLSLLMITYEKILFKYINMSWSHGNT